MGIKENMHDLLESAQEHSATLCAIGAVAGVFVTAWLSGRAAVKASRTIDPDMTRKDKIVLYCKTYAATAVSAGITTGLIIGSDRIHVGKEAVLAASAAIWKEKATDLDNKIKEELGEEKANELKKKIVEDKIKDAEDKGELAKPTETELGKIYCYEPYTDQYFYTTRETIAWAMLSANRRLCTEFDCRLNYIIKMLGGKEKPEGDKLGWNWENEVQDYCWSYYGGPWIDFYPGVQKNAPNGKTALVLFYQVDPETQEPEDMIYKEYGGT